MSLESVHKTLKQSMSRILHIAKHISMVYRTMCTDWLIRIIQQLEIIFISSEELKFNMKRIIAILLLGNDAIHLCNHVNEERRIVKQVFTADYLPIVWFRFFLIIVIPMKRILAVFETCLHIR